MRSDTVLRVRLAVVLLLSFALAACQGAPSAPGAEPTAAPGATAEVNPALPTDQPLLPAGDAVVVDNADPTFAVLAGQWGECWGSECSGTPYGESFRFAEPECLDCQAQFSLRVVTAGEYDVWAWWPAGEDRSTTTPYTISHGDESFDVRVDQRNSGSAWYRLATLSFPAGPARIVVGGSSTGYANADAVALTPAGTAAPGPLALGPTAELAAPAATEEPEVATEEPEVPTEAPTEAPPQPTLAPVPGGEALIIDYTMSDISRIPDEWLEQARRLTVHYAHTSHGSQIVTGLEWLAAQDARYAVAVRPCGSDLGLPEDAGVLRLCDGNPPDDYVTPELYWSTEEGLARTRTAAESGLFNISAWTWCGQQSENDAATVQQYLEALTGLEDAYPAVRFIYWTGHTDGGSEVLARNNDMVRQYVRENGKVLFDFASFEMYDPAGNYYPEASDACDWCEAWCNDHPEDCRGLEQMGDCAHTHPLQCRLKAQAFWWLMARLAGWDGNP